MNTAKNILTGEIVYGRVLKEMDETIVTGARFVCEYCGIPVIACSYHKINKRASYFKKSEEHVLPCPHKNNDTKIKKRRGVDSLVKEAPPYTPYISKLEIQGDNTSLKVSAPKPKTNEREESINQHQHDIIRQKRDRGGIERKNLARLVKFYIDEPKQRHRRLIVPEIDQNTYGTVFKLIGQTGTIYREDRRIYFGLLNIFQDITPINGSYYLSIINEPNSNKKMSEISIHIEDFDSELELSGFIELIKQKLEQGRQYFSNLNDASDLDKFVWIYFIGELEDEESQTFRMLLPEFTFVDFQNNFDFANGWLKKIFSCPECKLKLLKLRKSNYGLFWSCKGYPDCKYKMNDRNGFPVERSFLENTEISCEECEIGHMVKRKGKSGVFYGCSRFPDCKATLNKLNE